MIGLLASYVIAVSFSEKNQQNEIEKKDIEKRIKQILPSDSPNRLTKFQYEHEMELIESTQNFQGEDEKGKSILELLQQHLESKYSKTVLIDPQTQMGWHAYGMDTRVRCCYDVYFTIQTSDETTRYLWGIEQISHKVFAISPGRNNQAAIDIYYMTEN